MSDHSELKKAALRVVDIESSEGESISDAWEDFESAANPAAVLALIAEIDQLKSDSLCPACEGSGEGWVRSDNGPDAHNIQVDCPECFGPGTMLGAYQAMKIQRDSQIERTVKAGGDLLFMRSERDQLKAEVEALRNPASKKTDCGHGHVYPSISGYMARCGGPGLCAMCSRDTASKAIGMENQRVVPVMRECVKGYGHGGQWCGPDFNCWLDPRSKSEKNGHGKGCVCSVCTQ